MKHPLNSSPPSFLPPWLHCCGLAGVSCVVQRTVFQPQVTCVGFVAPPCLKDGHTSFTSSRVS